MFDRMIVIRWPGLVIHKQAAGPITYRILAMSHRERREQNDISTLQSQKYILYIMCSDITWWCDDCRSQQYEVTNTVKFGGDEFQ